MGGVDPEAGLGVPPMEQSWLRAKLLGLRVGRRGGSMLPSHTQRWGAWGIASE